MGKSRIVSLLLAATIALTPATSLGHSGRTDGSGGHKDNKNASGLGYYHYHHGMGPHLHNNGVCAYNSQTSKTTTTTKKLTASSSKTSSNKILQKRLNELGFNCGAIDGIIGKKTKAAIKSFQKSKGLVVDGIVGKNTKGALGI